MFAWHGRLWTAQPVTAPGIRAQPDTTHAAKLLIHKVQCKRPNLFTWNLQARPTSNWGTKRDVRVDSERFASGEVGETMFAKEFRQAGHTKRFTIS